MLNAQVAPFISPSWRINRQSNKKNVFLLLGACGKKDFSYNAHPVPMKNLKKFGYRYDAGIAQLVERNLAKVEVA
ncbi:hypothetical protein ACNPNQ_22660, partial [Serratia odorifera]